MTSEERPLRADARRNRARLLEVAEVVFATEGITVPIDEVARRAGMGVGTVYRHFPTKQSLFAAIILRQVEQLVDEAHAALGHAEPDRALFAFLTTVIERCGRNKALAAAFIRQEHDPAPAGAVPADRLRTALAALLERAHRIGAVRPEIGAAELHALITGLLRAGETVPDDPSLPSRLLPVLLAGLVIPERRPPTPGPPAADPPTHPGRGTTLPQ